MKKGYQEWITKDKIGFITNAFGRIMYVNVDWPDGEYVKWKKSTRSLAKQIRQNCKKGREFDTEELLLELI